MMDMKTEVNHLSEVDCSGVERTNVGPQTKTPKKATDNYSFVV